MAFYFLNRLFLFLGIVFVSCGAQATDARSTHRINCPATIPKEVVQISQSSTGWTPFVLADLRLSGARPMFGPPAERGFLKPSLTQDFKGKGFDRWQEMDGNIPGGKWIACSYGDRGDFLLAQQLDERTSECTVAYSTSKNGEKMFTIDCDW